MKPDFISKMPTGLIGHIEDFGELILKATWFSGSFMVFRKEDYFILLRRCNGWAIDHEGQHEPTALDNILYTELRLCRMVDPDFDGKLVEFLYRYAIKEEAELVITSALNHGAVTEFFGL